MFNIGPTELIVILVIALVVFGPKRLPEIGRTVGKSLREFRRATEDLKGELNMNIEDDLPADQPASGEPGYENWQAPSDPQSSSGNGAVETAAVAAVASGPDKPEPAAGDSGVESSPAQVPESAVHAESKPAMAGEDGSDDAGASWGWWPDKDPDQAGSAEEAEGGQAG